MSESEQVGDNKDVRREVQTIRTNALDAQPRFDVTSD